MEAFGKEIQKRRNDMLSYIIFLRVTPILPNTFINVASPVVQVPLMPFIAGNSQHISPPLYAMTLLYKLWCFLPCPTVVPNRNLMPRDKKKNA